MLFIYFRENYLIMYLSLYNAICLENIQYKIYLKNGSQSIGRVSLR